jgi:hypothetical protein
MNVPDRETEPVYPPHQYECDWAGDGRTCMVCGLLEGGANHTPEPVKGRSYAAPSRGIPVAFQSGRTPLNMDVPETARVYPPHQYECDWTGNGRCRMYCGLLEGGPTHSPEAIKDRSYDAANHAIRFVFQSGKIALIPL